MSDIEKLRKIGRMRKYSENELIFKQGDSGSEMFIILSGRVGVYSNSPGDSPLKVSEMGPGEFFGEMSVFENQPRSATAVTLQEAVVLSIERDNFLEFIAQQPSMAYKIMKSLSSRIRNLNEELLRLNPEKGGPEPADVPSAPKDEGKKDTAEVSPANTAAPNVDALKDILFLPGHKAYGLVAPESYGTYIFSKQVRCPVCNKNFNVKMPKNSKLKLDRVDYDFRKRYVDFEPLWYSIWVCPECYYSNFIADYEKIPFKSIKPLREKTGELKDKISVEFTEPRNIDQVFTAYYLSIFCANIYNAAPQKMGKLWIQLSWLYKDVNDEEMFKKTSSLALENYYNAFYKSKLNISAEQEQQYYLILGELFLLKGDEKEAQKHFYSAIKRNSGSQLLNQQAQDRLQEVKNRGYAGESE
ncbi:MAG: DUF2225 domain-containing protein [Clostridiales bacterium]|jgi:uncharacterized protein (DUF2225 family)|nr:DUF2225 domain-containing protein [Eubacteriales bacterium]MDH7566762.1 DUF2225 domain-containing protein [Clostridiales bacterium]